MFLGVPLFGADDGIRTRDPHLGKVMTGSARDRCNPLEPRSATAFTAGDRWNRSNPLEWSSSWSSRYSPTAMDAAVR
jgi:hypothetical protein